MYIMSVDPHPGRCLNHRVVNGMSVRCLDYDYVAHICTFPSPRAVASDVSVGSSGSYKIQETTPEPWVKPDSA